MEAKTKTKVKGWIGLILAVVGFSTYMGHKSSPSEHASVVDATSANNELATSEPYDCKTEGAFWAHLYMASQKDMIKEISGLTSPETDIALIGDEATSVEECTYRVKVNATYFSPTRNEFVDGMLAYGIKVREDGVELLYVKTNPLDES